MAKAYAFFADGFEETEAVFPIDLMRRAGIDVRTVSVTGKSEVKGSHGIIVTTDALFEQCDFTDGDLFFLPGGPGHKTLLAHTSLTALITEKCKAGKVIAAICASPMIFGTLGLLEGKKATCFPGFEQYLKGATHTGAPAETDGNIITGRSAGAALQFALECVSALCGADAKARIAKEIVV